MRLVGKIKEAHGLKGDVYVLIFADDVSWMDRLESFGVGDLPAQGDEPGPDAVKRTLTCERVKEFKKGLIVKPGEVNDRNASEKLVGLGFYVPDEFFVSDEGEQIFLEELEGFEVRDPQGKVLGEVVGFSTNTIQDLLVVQTVQGHESEVPFVDEFIVELNFDEGFIAMDLPEGLLDLELAAGGDKREDDAE